MSYINGADNARAVGVTPGYYEKLSGSKSEEDNNNIWKAVWATAAAAGATAAFFACFEKVPVKEPDIDPELSKTIADTKAKEAEIIQSLAATNQVLEKLGMPRATSNEQAKKFLDIMKQIESADKDGISAMKETINKSDILQNQKDALLKLWQARNAALTWDEDGGGKGLLEAQNIANAWDLVDKLDSDNARRQEVEQAWKDCTDNITSNPEVSGEVIEQSTIPQESLEYEDSNNNTVKLLGKKELTSLLNKAKADTETINGINKPFSEDDITKLASIDENNPFLGADIKEKIQEAKKQQEKIQEAKAIIAQEDLTADDLAKLNEIATNTDTPVSLQEAISKKVGASASADLKEANIGGYYTMATSVLDTYNNEVISALNAQDGAETTPNKNFPVSIEEAQQMLTHIGLTPGEDIVKKAAGTDGKINEKELAAILALADGKLDIASGKFTFDGPVDNNIENNTESNALLYSGSNRTIKDIIKQFRNYKPPVAQNPA